jgi:hypothetical protein
MLEKEKLAANGGNYADWIQNLIFVLRCAKKEYVLDQPLGDAPAKNASPEDVAAYTACNDDYEAVQCLMLTCMDPELQKCFERSNTQFIIASLEILYQKQARTERFELTKALIECKMKEGSSISEHIVKLAGYVDRLASLEFGIPPTLGIYIVLASLPPILQWFYHELKHERDGEKCKRVVRYAQNYRSWDAEEQRSVDGHQDCQFHEGQVQEEICWCRLDCSS